MNVLNTIEIPRYLRGSHPKAGRLRSCDAHHALMQFATHTKHPIVRTEDCNLPQVGHSQCSLPPVSPVPDATAISRRVCAPSLPQVCLKNNIRTYKHFDSYDIDYTRQVCRDASQDNLVAIYLYD